MIAIATGNKAGYYIAGISVLSTAFRPAAAYFSHLRERIKVLNRESTHPRDDVATLLHRADMLEQFVGELRTHQRNADEDLRRTKSVLTDTIAHAQHVLAADLNRLQDIQAADRAAGRSRDEDLERRIWSGDAQDRGDPGGNQRSPGTAGRAARAGPDGQVRSSVMGRRSACLGTRYPVRAVGPGQLGQAG